MHNKNPVIAVIDSGVSSTHHFDNCILGGATIARCLNSEEILITPSIFEDNLGHGTAVIDAINKACPNAYFYVIKIFSETLETTFDVLHAAIAHSLTYEDVDIIHVSAGVTYMDNYETFTATLNLAVSKGITIISAFDNDGAVSYPAACEQVIGVDMYAATKNKNHLIYVENSIINVLAPDNFYRLKWVTPPEVIIKGSSFSVCSVTGRIAKYIADNAQRLSRTQIAALMKEDCGNVIPSPSAQCNTWEKGKYFVNKIKKAVVFPFNKEVHALAAYRSDLSFALVGVYDARHSRNLGKRIGDILKHTSHDDMLVQNIDSLDWNDDFDTIICGHCTELSTGTGKNYHDDITRKALKYEKMLYSFDHISPIYRALYDSSQQCSQFTPEILPSDVPCNQFGKLRNRLTPTVGVFGTSSVQGKFTMQMELRRRFIRDGYKVANISTEPHGYLFGFDGCYPFGYQSTVGVSGADALKVINEMVWDVTDKSGKDVLLVGGQSGVVAYDHGNVAQYPLEQYSFISATISDVYVICINPYDEIDYIKRSILYLQSFQDAKVVAACLYPITIAPNNLGYALSRKSLPLNELDKIKNSFSQALSIPVCILGDLSGIEIIYQSILHELAD